MHIRGLIFWLVFNIYWSDASSNEYGTSEHANGQKAAQENQKNTVSNELAPATDGETNCITYIRH